MREIPLGWYGRQVALVDDEDYERIAAHRWHARIDGYAVRWSADKTRRIRMHREVLGCEPGVIVDHVNGNGLDNRRANLRVCTWADNARNCAAVKGKRIKGVQRVSAFTWRARIRIDGHLTHIGSFGSEYEAALAYDAAARKHFGEFACVNFPNTGERPAASTNALVA